MRRAAIFLALSLLAASGAAAAAEAPRVHVVSFALFGDQDVFAREAQKAAAIVHKQFGGEVVVRINTRAKRAAMIADLAKVLKEVGAGMDADRDVLFLLATSHGTPAGAFVKSGAVTEVLSPGELKDMLEASGIKHSIVVISACYSGVFADALADPATLVITASDARHPSFGCRNGADWTYFGRAFFAEALHETRNLKDAFAAAAAAIIKREAAMRLPHSNPQLAGGELVLARLGQGDGQGPAAANLASAPPATAHCMLKIEPLPDNAACKVFSGYSNGRRIGAFRLADRRSKARRIGVAAGGACPDDFVKGELIAASKIRAGREVYTLSPDCRSSVRTTQ